MTYIKRDTSVPNSLVLNEKELVGAPGGRGGTLLDGRGGQGIHSSPIMLLWKEDKELRNRGEAEAVPGHRQCLWVVRPVELELRVHLYSSRFCTGNFFRPSFFKQL